MADPLKFQIVVDGQERIQQAMAQASGSIEKVSTEAAGHFGKMSGHAERAGQSMEYSMGAATHAIRGLGEEIGLRMPRFVSRFIAESETIGPLLAKAFSAVAVIGLIQILAELPEVFNKLAGAITGWDAKAKAAYDEEIRLNYEYLKLTTEIYEAQLKIQGLAESDVTAAVIQKKTELLREQQHILVESDRQLHKMDDSWILLGYNVGNAWSYVKGYFTGANREYDEWLKKHEEAQKRAAELALDLKKTTEIKLPELKHKEDEEAYKKKLSAMAETARMENEAWSAHVRHDEESRKYDEETEKISRTAAAEQMKTLQDMANLRSEHMAKELEEADHALTKEAERAKKIAVEIGETLKDRANFQLSTNEKTNDELLKTRQISTDRWLTNEKAAVDDWYEQQKAALTMAGLDWAGYQRALEKLDQERAIKIQVAEHKAETLRLAAMARLDTFLTNALNRWTMGQETFGQAAIKTWQNLATQAISNIERIMIMEAVAHLAHQKNTEAQKLTDAKEAARKAFKSVWGALPYPANAIVAPIVAAGAFAGVMAFDQGGLVPYDSLAMVHKNEMVLSPSLSAAVQDMAAAGGAGGAVHMNLHFNGDTDRKTVDYAATTLRRELNKLVRRGAIRVP